MQINEDLILHNKKLLDIYNNIFENFNYRAYEQEIGTWINEKPLYRQTFGFNNITLGQEQTILWSNSIFSSNSISNVNEIIHYDAFYKRSDGSFQQVPNVHAVPTMWNSSIYDLGGYGFNFYVGTLADAWSVDYLVVTIYYTKL